MRYFLLLFFALLSTGCSSHSPKSWVEVKGKRFVVEVMTTHDGRSRGLMFRDSLEDGNGMLFVHEAEQPMSYWMKNTKIPLDIIYFDANKKLVSVQQRVPPCTDGDRCPNFPSEADAKFVLELNAGSFEKHQFSKGDVIVFADDIPETGAP